MRISLRDDEVAIFAAILAHAHNADRGTGSPESEARGDLMYARLVTACSQVDGTSDTFLPETNATIRRAVEAIEKAFAAKHPKVKS
jgi:hypothetical protein